MNSGVTRYSSKEEQKRLLNRALELKAQYPYMSWILIAERLNVSKHCLREWRKKWISS